MRSAKGAGPRQGDALSFPPRWRIAVHFALEWKERRRISDHASMKLKNQLAILRRIRDEGPISRVDIKQRTLLSWGTVTTSTKELLDRGIITEIGAVTTGVGRRPVELDLNKAEQLRPRPPAGKPPGARGSHGRQGHRGGRAGSPRGLPRQRPGRCWPACWTRARRILQRHSISRTLLAGVGIAAPGAVDFSTGVCLYAPHHPHLKDVPLKKKFEQAFGVPCFVDHDFQLLRAERTALRLRQGLDSFICVLVGNGHGAGIALHGEVYRGADSLAGEFGHTCIDAEGPLCACGNNGCLEALASGSAIAGHGAARAAVSASPSSTILGPVRRRSRTRSPRKPSRLPPRAG